MVTYLLGSIPTGFLVAKARGVDIRKTGSGNIGATNVLRVLGKPAGISVFLVDVVKGFAAVALVFNFYPGLHDHLPGFFPFEVAGHPEVRFNYAILAGACAVLGHIYTCWLSFKGGKGIATSAGVFLALAPIAACIALGVWILLLAASRFVSVASIGAAVALPTAVWLTTNSTCLGVVTTGLGVLAIYKHKSNIQRLMAGKEHRLGEKSSEPTAQSPTSAK